MKNLENSEEPDQMPHCVASDLGLHFLEVSSIKWVKINV